MQLVRQKLRTAIRLGDRSVLSCYPCAASRRAVAPCRSNRFAGLEKPLGNLHRNLGPVNIELIVDPFSIWPFHETCDNLGAVFHCRQDGGALREIPIAISCVKSLRAKAYRSRATWEVFVSNRHLNATGL